MKLIVVRHGKAEDRDKFRKTNPNDEERPLTDKGRKEMARAALGLARLEPKTDLILTSPLMRARETAEFISRVLPPGTKFEETDLLAPGVRFEKLFSYLKAKGRKCIVIVGHEPDLSSFVAWCCTRQVRSFLRFKKGTACMLEVAEDGTAELVWQLPNALLRDFAKR